MKEFYNSQTPPSEEPRSTSTHTGDTGHSGDRCPEMLEDVNYINNNNNNYYYYRPQQNQGWNHQRPNYSERRSRTPRHPNLHRHGGLPRSTLRLCLQRQHYAQGRPFLNTSGAVIHASAAKISFYINGRRFPSRTRLHKSQSNPDMKQGRGPTGGTGTSKCGPSQLRWSLLFKEVKIVDLSHRS